MKIYKTELVENVTILHKNEKEISKDLNSAIQEGWTILGETMFGYEKKNFNIPKDKIEGFIEEHGDDFDFIETYNGYELFYTKCTRIVPSGKDLIQDIFSL
jgi:hypothetical protein